MSVCHQGFPLRLERIAGDQVEEIVYLLLYQPRLNVTLKSEKPLGSQKASIAFVQDGKDENSIVVVVKFRFDYNRPERQALPKVFRQQLLDYDGRVFYLLCCHHVLSSLRSYEVGLPVGSFGRMTVDQILDAPEQTIWIQKYGFFSKCRFAIRASHSDLSEYWVTK